MPRYGISIEKTLLFRGVQQPFANVYYYEAPSVAVTADVDLNSLVDQIVTQEKTFHAGRVTFTRGRLWNTGSGSQAGNQMRVDKQLSGTGALTSLINMDGERAYLMQWRAGFNSRGKPVYLRKWYHTCGTPPGQTLTSDTLENEAPMSQAQRDAMVTAVNPLTELELLGSPVAELCAQSGREITGSLTCHPYLEHHQLGDQWR